MADHPSYRRRAYRLPSELEDDLVADLWTAGTLGVESTATGEGWVLLAAWFSDPPAPGQEAELDRLQDRWRRRGVEGLGVEAVAEQDWLAAWREKAQPLEVGRRFLLDPREPEMLGDDDGGAEPAFGEGRIRLRLPARRAFGTGSHESTRLAVELLEDFFAAAPSPQAVRVLDVGTGTGVLAFVALCLGAGFAVGCDIDPQAVFQARANAVLNRRALGALPVSPSGASESRRFAMPGTSSARGRVVSESPHRRGRETGRALSSAPAYEPGRAQGEPPRAPGWFAGGVAALAPVELDLVVANILPERILPEIAEVGRRVGAGGELIVSGILETRGPAVLARFGEIGLTAAASRREGEWVAYRLRRKGG